MSEGGERPDTSRNQVTSCGRPELCREKPIGVIRIPDGFSVTNFGIRNSGNFDPHFNKDMCACRSHTLDTEGSSTSESYDVWYFICFVSELSTHHRKQNFALKQLLFADRITD
jgi:hypothetical protein